MTQRETQVQQYLYEHVPYKRLYWCDFDMSILSKVLVVPVHKRNKQVYYYNNCIVAADTETSKRAGHTDKPEENHVVAWTISIMVQSIAICTLYGAYPSEMAQCLDAIHKALVGDHTLVYFHNLSYDWVFMRQFFMKQWGQPLGMLATKPHYPISIDFPNGLTFRDSLIIAQRGLEKWGADLDVYHKKAAGKWDYDKIRNQNTADFTADELEYIEHDTLALAECLDATAGALDKRCCQLPYTATGIVREQFRKCAKKNRGREWFLKQYLEYEQLPLAETVYHGGYTHANRYKAHTVVDLTYTDGRDVECYDLASSYPWALISEKYPSEKFRNYKDCTVGEIVQLSDTYASMFTAVFTNIRLKDQGFPMPPLQFSKCVKIAGEMLDNGRVLSADAAIVTLCDIDLKLIDQYYEYDTGHCTNVLIARKDYLPKWFTDFVFEKFIEKTKFKGGDPVQYAIAKAILNSIYGMCCQHPLQDIIEEDYDTGAYSTDRVRSLSAYEDYINSHNTFLPYQIGIWCTAYAMKNLFELGECVGNDGEWLYSDTDSCFAYGWDYDKLKAYNDKRLGLLHARGYDGVWSEAKQRYYYLGIAELDKTATEFKAIHAKCYVYRDKASDILKITVAGVPKGGSICLKNDISNFVPGFIFDGETTGKKTHSYIFTAMHIDEYGNEIGDSIDLQSCNYVINDINTISFDELITEDINVGRKY